MKTSIKNLLLLLLLLGLPGVVPAQDAYSTNADGSIYTYSTNADGSATIVAYAGPRWVVTIPTNINGLTVTSIGTNAFENNTSLTSVTIPGSVTSIGEEAFEECFNLTNATIDNGVTSIGDSAFFYCTSLMSVTIGTNVTSIGDSAFAFCTSLTSVTIPDNVTSIGYRAVFDCASLTSVTIPNSVTSIGYEAFGFCSRLTNITVDASNPAYSSMNGVLFDKAQATLLQFPGGLGGSYTIPNSVTSIGDDAIGDCTSLTSVTIPGSVTSIGYEAFTSDNLTNVTIPNSVTNIGGLAFYGCPSLTNATIGSGVTSIGDDAFADCTSLTGVYFKGNSPTPTNDLYVFGPGVYSTVYYLPGTTGWGAMFDGLPTAPWFLPNPQILNNGPGFGVQPGGFGFTISWATNVSVVVQAATNLANPVWIPVSTNPLVNGTNAFRDPTWTNYPQRFYRVASAFTVGGTLTGLPAGDTVTLQDNGSDNLTLSANGTFTFPTALPNGHTYSVTGSGTSGGTPTTCTLTNGSGTISGANVTNVAVQCTSAHTCPALTGDMDLDMYNAAVADGTANGGVPAVMFTKRGGPFRVTAIGTCSQNVALTYSQAWFDMTVGSNSCSSTTFPSGAWVIAFGTPLICGFGPFEY